MIWRQAFRRMYRAKISNFMYILKDMICKQESSKSSIVPLSLLKEQPNVEQRSGFSPAIFHFSAYV